MEKSTPENILCDGHAKAMQQCLTDIFTSVYTTCEIRENSIFGPCVLSHTSMYDSIAFIALKSSDKRTSPYVFRVDTSTASSSSQSRMWLRLVQSARDNDERNLEAYVKNGQLFYRSLRRIEKNEELLVWYGKDLMELLLLRSHRAPGETKESPPYCCSHCSHRFQFEFPYLAHLRFHCSKRPQSIKSAEEIPKQSSDYLSSASTPSSPKMNRSERRSNFQDGKPATDFHNLARDLENNTNCQTSDKDKSTSKRKLKNIEDSSGSFLQPLTLNADSSNTPLQYRGAYISGENRRSFRPSGPEPTDTKRSAFTEVKKAPNSQKHSSENLSSNSENKNSRPNCNIEEKLASPVLTETQPQPHVESSSTTSAFTSVLQQVAGGERKSAFSQPSHSLSQLSHLVMTPKLLPSLHCHPAIGSTASANRIYQSDSLSAKLQGSELLQGALPKHSPFLYATAFWPKSSGPVQMQIPSSLTLLPPSFASLCLPAQNWCAKCNASFRMTSDLVYHMRSHHKKEFSMEPLVKRRREEKLKCPICSESFRERHHLSRHMTSHN